MNYIKRAIQSLWAKKGRSIIMIAVFSAILIFVLAGLTIRSGAELATTNAKKSVGATVTLSTNREAMFGQRSESDTDSDEESSRPDPGSFERTPVNLSDAKKIAKLSNVKSYSFEATTSADKSTGITPISSDSDSEEEASDEQAAGFGGQGAPGGMSQGDFQIKGVSKSSSYSDFSSGTASIVEGEAITAEDEGTNNVLIEQSLAEANDLSVGDKFKIKDTDDKDVEVAIKGIYKTSDSGDSMGTRFNFMNPANTIFSSYTMVNTLTGSDGKTIDSAVYNLDDPKDMDKDMDSFVKNANKLIDTETFSLETNDQMYQQMLQPLNNVSSFAKNIVILVAVAGVIILTLIIMLSIRERKYEIGVLLSLGESRSKVISQFFVEIFVCMIFALGIAAASGNVVGNAVGNQLLSQQTTSQNADGQADAAGNDGPGQGQMPSGGNGDGPGGRQMGSNPFSQTEEIQELNISMQPAEILSLAGIGLGISLFSIVLSSAGILRLNPKKILIS
ncbi:ABC transporter permease [Enterococcus sp. AZ196]|uniref:ABC transporter permease n=1 Tax=Enterococcus sp. AZ196 TaxID=2774659 RepID=UPI003D277CA3